MMLSEWELGYHLWTSVMCPTWGQGNKGMAYYTVHSTGIRLSILHCSTWGMYCWWHILLMVYTVLISEWELRYQTISTVHAVCPYGAQVNFIYTVLISEWDHIFQTHSIMEPGEQGNNIWTLLILEWKLQYQTISNVQGGQGNDIYSADIRMRVHKVRESQEMA